MNFLKDISRNIQETIQSVLPSIVEIQAWRTRSSLNPMKYLEGDECEDSAGAGVIIKADGVILTNHHVVERATRLSVKLQDGRIFEPESVYSDPVSDIAVLKVPERGLAIPPLDKERTAELGEIVFAIGHPLGYTATITMHREC